MFRLTAICFTISLTAGCTSIALRHSTGSVASGIGAIMEQQIADNLGRYKKHPGSFPYQMILGQGAITVQNSVAPTLKLPYTLTQKNSKETDLGATMQWQEAWTITPVMDSADLKRLKFVYECAVNGCPDDKQYEESSKNDESKAAPTLKVVKQFFVDRAPVTWLAFGTCSSIHQDWVSLGSHHGFEVCVEQNGLSQFTFLLMQVAVDTQSSNKTKGAFLAL